MRSPRKSDGSRLQMLFKIDVLKNFTENLDSLFNKLQDTSGGCFWKEPMKELA